VFTSNFIEAIACAGTSSIEGLDSKGDSEESR
jgi:hypothetical protein